jgi:hypothetical protein
VLSYNIGFYDFYHLGVMLFQTGRLNEALQQKIDIYPFADLYYYYIAKIYEILFDKQNFTQSIESVYEYYTEESLYQD